MIGNLVHYNILDLIQYLGQYQFRLMLDMKVTSRV